MPECHDIFRCFHFYGTCFLCFLDGFNISLISWQCFYILIVQFFICKGYSTFYMTTQILINKRFFVQNKILKSVKIISICWIKISPSIWLGFFEYFSLCLYQVLNSYYIGNSFRVVSAL